MEVYDAQIHVGVMHDFLELSIGSIIYDTVRSLVRTLLLPTTLIYSISSYRKSLSSLDLTTLSQLWPISYN